MQVDQTTLKRHPMLEFTEITAVRPCKKWISERHVVPANWIGKAIYRKY